MALIVPRPPPFARSQRRGDARAVAYRLHLLVGLAISLGAVTAAFRAPWSAEPRAVGWGAQSADAFEVLFEETEPAGSGAGSDLASRYRIEVAAGEDPAPPEDEGHVAPAEIGTTMPEELAPRPELEKLTPILEFAEESPELVGGLGGLYLHIRYPQAAIDQGIQGLVVLRFVVEPDGHTSEIVVEKSLHALCDSAAVRALREVAFVPGRQNGKPARVRMRLPVRFRLVDPGGEPVQDSSLATAG